MPDRRTVLRYLAVAVAGAAGRLSLGRAASAAAADSNIRIVDQALLQGAELALALRAAPEVRVVPFSGDPGGVWMRVVEPVLRERRQLVAGITSPPTLFCLQYLARDHGYMLVGRERGIVPFAAQPVADTLSGELIDLRHENYRDPRAAWSWLLAPRKV
jgi:hypothetical protein